MEDMEIYGPEKPVEVTAEEVLAVDADGVEIAAADTEALPLHDELSFEAQVEAVVFAAPAPLQPHEVVEYLGQTITLKQAEHILDQLVEVHKLRAGGFGMEYIKGHGYQFRTVHAAATIMERMFASRPRPISRAALETLSIIAYRQPVTRAEVEFIRGVDAGSIIKNLLERNLISCVGRKEEAGRPMIFGTTAEFLKIFRLNGLDELPPLQSFQPPREMIDAAMAQLGPADDVDLEDYVGDDSQPAPEFSEGLIIEPDTTDIKPLES